jgi:hypothetical protein
MFTAKLFARKRPNHRHCYAYDIEFDGELIVTDSRDPERDVARALLARGLAGHVTLLDAVTDRPRTIVNVERAAPWSIGSNLERYRWKPTKSSDSSSPTAEDDLVLPTIPWDVDAA